MIEQWTRRDRLVLFALDIDGREVNFMFAPKEIEPELDDPAGMVLAAIRHRAVIEAEAMRAYRATPHQGDGSAQRPIMIKFGGLR